MIGNISPPSPILTAAIPAVQSGFDYIGAGDWYGLLSHYWIQIILCFVLGYVCMRVVHDLGATYSEKDLHFNRIRIDLQWIVLKIILLLLAVAGFMQDMRIPAIVLLLIVCQSTFHEFAHAIVIKLLRGSIFKIRLSNKGSNVSFGVSSERSRAIVLLTGFIWDSAFTVINLYLLMITGSIFWIFVGVLITWMFLYYTIVPNESDFNQVFRKAIE